MRPLPTCLVARTPARRAGPRPADRAHRRPGGRWGPGAVLLAAAALAAAPAAAAPAAVADMTWPEFEAAAREGSVVLWALGSLEAHGPHLPLDTDVRIPDRQLGVVQAELAAAGVRAVVLPTYAWGVNQVTDAFPGSIQVRPDIMSGLMADVLRSVAKAGFRQAYLITGHYDAAHSRAILAAVREVDGPAIRVRYLAPASVARRLELRPGDPVTPVELPVPVVRAHPDLHAGGNETAAMLYAAPGSVRVGTAEALPALELTPEALARWRQGGEAARQLTPQAYLGAPATATREEGRAKITSEASAYARAILADRAAAPPVGR